MTRPTREMTTERLLLRAPRASDLSAYRGHYTSARSRFQGGPYSAYACFEKFASMIGHWDLRGFGRYVIDLDGDGIGHVGPLQIGDDEAPELTWALWSEAVEGNGYATEAARAVACHLLADCDWDGVDILIDPANAPSARVAQRIGAAMTEKTAPNWCKGANVYRLTAEVLA